MQQSTITLQLNSLPRFIKTCTRCHSPFYENGGRFRVNANGKRLDIWLVCRCELCKSTWNLSVYDRIGRAALNREDFLGYLANDHALILRHVFDPAFLQKNHASLDLEGMDISASGDIPSEGDAAHVVVRLTQPMPLSVGRGISLALGISLSRVRRMQKDGMLQISSDLKKAIAENTISFSLVQGWLRGNA